MKHDRDKFREDIFRDIDALAAEAGTSTTVMTQESQVPPELELPPAEPALELEAKVGEERSASDQQKHAELQALEEQILAQKLVGAKTEMDKLFDSVKLNLRLASISIGKATDRSDREDFDEGIATAQGKMTEMQKAVLNLPAQIQREAQNYYNFCKGEYDNAVRSLHEGWVKKEGPVLFSEEPQALTTEPVKQEQVKDLDTLRKEYIAAKKHLENLTGIKRLLHLTESKPKVEQEFESARQAYEKARAEYVGSHIDKFIEEKTKLAGEHIAQATKGKYVKYLNKYKALGDHNVLNSLEKRGKKIENKFARFGLRMVNARTAISGGLLVGGIFLAPGTMVGISALVARRGFSFLGTSTGSYDLANMGRNVLNRGSIEKALKDAVVHSDKLEQFMASLESRAILDGKSPASLTEDKLYQQLLERYQKEIEGQAQTEARPEAFLDRRLSSVDDQLTDKLKSEKKTRLGVAAVSTVVGGLISSGYLQGKLLHHGQTQHPGATKPLDHKPVATQTETQQPVTVKHGLKSDVLQTSKSIPAEHSTPAVEHPAETPKAPDVAHAETTKVPAAIEHPAANTPAEAVHPEIASGAEQIEIGGRGIEGSLIDAMKDGKHEQLYKWLLENYAAKAADGDNSPAALVHRFIIAQGGDEKWHFVGKGSMLELKPSGEVVLDTSHIHILEHTAAAPETAGQSAVDQTTAFGHAAAPVFSHDEIPVPVPGDPAFNFQHLSEEYIGRHGLPAYEQAMNETTRTTVFTTDDAKDLYVVQHARDQAVAALGKTEAVKFEHQVEDFAKYTASSGSAGTTVATESAPTAAGTTAAKTAALKPVELPKVELPLAPAEIAEHVAPTASLTEALKEIWPVGIYQEIMEKINLSGDVLNGNVSHMSLAEFTHTAGTDSDFANKFKGLGKFLHDRLPENSSVSNEFLEQTSIRDFLTKWLPKNYHAN